MNRDQDAGCELTFHHLDRECFYRSAIRSGAPIITSDANKNEGKEIKKIDTKVNQSLVNVKSTSPMSVFSGRGFPDQSLISC